MMLTTISQSQKIRQAICQAARCWGTITREPHPEDNPPTCRFNAIDTAFYEDLNRVWPWTLKYSEGGPDGPTVVLYRESALRQSWTLAKFLENWS